MYFEVEGSLFRNNFYFIEWRNKELFMEEINLYDLMKHYVKFWALIAGFTIAGLAVGLTYNSYIQKPIYKSTSSLILIDGSVPSVSSKATTIRNYQELIKSRRVLEPVIKDLKLSQSYEQLVSNTETNNNKDTEVLTISVSTSNAKTSKDVVDATIASFKTQIKQLYNQDNTKVVDFANTPEQPTNIHKAMQLILTTLVGLIASLVVVFFIYDFNLSSTKRDKKPSKKLVRKSIKTATKRKKTTTKVTPKKKPKTSKNKIKSLKKK